MTDDTYVLSCISQGLDVIKLAVINCPRGRLQRRAAALWDGMDFKTLEMKGKYCGSVGLVQASFLRLQPCGRSGGF